MTNIDEAALKAGRDELRDEIAKGWNTGGSEGAAKAVRALLHRSQGQEPVAEGFVDQHGKVINASATIGYLRPCPEDAANGCKIIPLFTHPAPVAVVPAEQAEDSAMRKDAMRYRWLRDTNCSDVMRGSGHLEPLEVERIYFGRPVAEWFLDDFAFAPTGAAFDAAIDAAIGRNREAGGS